MFGTKKQRAEKLLANAYASLAHTEYNCAGHIDTQELIDFRKALKLLDLDINRHLPDECPKI